ncbi:GNAT family N-acetyltransferase [Alkaliphilus hydrothermalis]|uniref:GNAT superfamily N-acetyltransferase n=1 Tax=Alkaliphilus hydrothermalis TaxID=1482730 RepID=A0ABS2NU31_9FIRM|nr:GNAT family N-acetyltransferase [Alkaliphilus hydrothermalis]MBM7616089.1 GNAT superfamily N-acetyltransferase [Alkaliphilus hydrothermalis]
MSNQIINQINNQINNEINEVKEINGLEEKKDLEITIERITKDNYHMYDDMVSWRIHGKERTPEEKDLNKLKDFQDAYTLLEQQGYYAYAALVEERYVGWITLINVPKIGKWNRGVIYVEEVWTEPGYRRKGIALNLMKKAFDVQKETGAIKVRLYTNTEGARKLYEKSGLKVTAENVIFMESEEF